MSIYKKLLEVQKEVGAISKDSKNPFFKSKYFDINKLIEVVNPVLSKHGLVLLQPIKDNKVYSVIVDSESDGKDKVESYLELPNLTKPQDIGSAISYYRRYTLSSLLGLQAEDEDGNGLKPKPKPPVDLTKTDIGKALKDCETVNALGTMFKGLTKENQTKFGKLVTEFKLELEKVNK